jgi:hypothetical protein
MDIHFNKQTFLYKDLWQKGTGLARTDKRFTRGLVPHAAIVLRLTPAVTFK